MGLKLFVAYHKAVDMPAASYLEPIPSTQRVGDHIADRMSYCELRAQYWVWRNRYYGDADYVGFFHYRRYLDLPSRQIIPAPVGRRPVPYKIRKRPDAKAYSDPTLEALVKEFDVIAPVWEYTGVPVRQRYQASGKQRSEDLDTVSQIILEKYPEFTDALHTYLSGQGEYYGNIYIMRWPYFQKYCAWLFSVLLEFDRRAVGIPPFTDGFLGERLFGIYFIWLLRQGEARCGEMPRVHYYAYDDTSHHVFQERFVNLIMPPGSKLRGRVRKTLYRMKEKRCK